ncbi:CHAT domain-containing protein [Streptomyces torulosus]|uniref:CHAT domain-containing protein n=1 Tax=Streptomyces torulosus TaxID=68276 RepID=UPI0012FEFA47|nr:CHAT domain-containing protein [Streptomyces torulosus]
MPAVLELQICQPHPRQYEVRVLKSAAGGEPRARLRLDVDELLAQRPDLENVVLSSVAESDPVPELEQALQNVGRQLFDALFAGPVAGAYRASRGVAKERQESLQIILRLEPPELTLLPWEALFDPLTNSYVCRQEPVVRHLAAEHTPNVLPVQPPLRILAVIASPEGLPELDSDAERSRLEEALTEQFAEGRVELDWLLDATWSNLQTRLLRGPWHIIHFIGHGDYDVESNKGWIALVGENGGAEKAEASRLADLVLTEAKPNPRLMVLNSCASAQGGGCDKFASVGSLLVDRGISAVAAMQFSVSDGAAVRFAHGFYKSLACGSRVDDAVRSGRISMLGDSHSLEWITPVLYVHGEANSLFDLTGRSQNLKKGANRAARLRRLYDEAHTEFLLGHFGDATELLDDLLFRDPENSDAIKLRHRVIREAQLSKLYDRAAEAEESSSWGTAIECYERITQRDSEYRDSVARLEFCRGRRYISHLWEKLRSCASEMRWQDALELGEEICQLDPAGDDLDGLITRARQEVAKVQRAEYLGNLYVQARAAEHSEEWDAAIDCYEYIVQSGLDYRDCVWRLDLCRNRRAASRLQKELREHASEGRWQSALEVGEKLESLVPGAADRDGLFTRARQEVAREQRTEYLEGIYALARASERSEEWDAAVNYYEILVAEGEGYRDSMQRRTLCLKRQGKAQGGRAESESPTVLAVRDVDIAAPCGAVVWATDGESIAVDMRLEARIRVFDTVGKVRLNIRTGSKGAPYTVAFSPDGWHIVGRAKKGLSIWNAHTGSRLLQAPTRGQVTAADFNRDGSRIAIGGQDAAYVWDAETVEEVFSAEQRFVQAVTFSPDGTRLLVADGRGLSVWEIETGLQVFEDRRGFLSSVAYSPDGKRAAAGGGVEGKAYLWTSGHVYELAHGAPVTAVEFSPESAWLATGSGDQLARIWNAENSHLLCKIHHEDPVVSLAFSPDGSRLVTGTQRAVTVWKIQVIPT